MLTPVVCPTCGYPLADVSEIFRERAAKLSRAALEKTGVAPVQASIIVEQNPMGQVDLPMEPVLKELHIDYDCCRMHLATAMDWRDYY
jgi:DNA-directed RNA polymerase subunit N (RpoN/RPB10)